MAQARQKLLISSELEQVRFLGAAVRAVLANLRYPEEQAASIELCLIEAVNNVIEHGYRREPQHFVEVALCADAEAIELTVRDSGLAMPEGALERAREKEAVLDRAAELGGPGGLGETECPGDALELDSVAEGGYGLRLITQVMNEVDYRRDGGHNLLTMKMRLGSAPEHVARATVVE